MKTLLQKISIRFLFLVLACQSMNLEVRAEIDNAQTDVKYLFNTYRLGQATILPWPGTYWPFDGRGIDYIPKGQILSPAQKNDIFFGLGTKTKDWEDQNHNCDMLPKDQQNDCKGWYGHCNGWTAASLNSLELNYTNPIVVTNPNTNVTMEFNYMDIKALLSEAWLDVWATYEGTGLGIEADAWIFDPQDPISRQTTRNDPYLSNFQAYWDVSPRMVFFALTNYIGIQKQGLAMDRFTGSQIWNQPVGAYRLLPIHGSNQPITQNGMSLYPVTFGVKIYWANDSVNYGYQRTASLYWNINDPKFSTDIVPNPMGDSDAQDISPDANSPAYLSRYMAFTLYFDAPVVVNFDGTKIESMGRLVGDGVWLQSDKNFQDTWYPRYADGGNRYELGQTHPDFIWRPSYLINAEFRNPFIDPVLIYKYILPTQQFRVEPYFGHLTGE